MAFDIANEFFLDFIKVLNDKNVSYLLVGGYAVNFYGYNRNTADMDIWIKPDNIERDKLIEALVSLGYERNEVSPIGEEDFELHQCFTFGSMPNHIDVLTYLHKNIAFEEAFHESVKHQLDNGELIRVIPYNILLDVKTRSSRPKDWMDVAQLKEIEQLKQDNKPRL